MAEILGLSKSIWGFNPGTDISGCVMWLDGSDRATMFQDTAGTTPVTGGGQTVQRWRDKSGNSKDVTGTGTWSGSNMVFNGSTNAFSNTTTVIPVVPAQPTFLNDYSIFAVYSNTVAPAALAYMNAVYGSNGFPMLGVYDVTQQVSTRSVAANVGGYSRQVGWATYYNTTFVGLAGVVGIGTDTEQNVYTTGSFGGNGAISFNDAVGLTGGVIATSASGRGGASGNDAFIAKYTSDGQFIWAACIASLGPDAGNALATDTSGNVFVTGFYSSNVTFYNATQRTGTTLGTSGPTLPYSGVNDCFIAKYSTTGTVLWAAQIAGTSLDKGFGIATDSSGNVFVGGQYLNPLSFYNAGETIVRATLAFIGNYDAFIAKYTSTGTLSWAARIGSTATDQINAVATDSSGNVFVTGEFSGALTLYSTGGTSSNTLPYVGGIDCFLAKYTSAGTIDWAARIVGTTTSADTGNGIATDSSGNVFVIGKCGTPMSFYNAGGTVIGSTQSEGGIFIVKYSSTGTVVWRTCIVGGGEGRAIATDSSGNVFVTGSYLTTIIFRNSDGTGNFSLALVQNSDTFFAKYSPTGYLIWATNLQGAGSETGTCVSTDSSGNVFFGGVFASSNTLYNADRTVAGTFPTASLSGMFVIKYTPDGYVTAPYKANSNVLVDVTFRFSTNVMSTFINGSPPTVASVTNPTAATTGINIGGPSNYFNGTISEVLIYSANLTTGQRQIVEGYLSYKWGIQTSLSTIQPFYRSIPFAQYFAPVNIPSCSVWMDGGDNSTMNSTTAVTIWRDKSGNSNTMTGSGTWSGSNMVFDGSTNAFSNLTYVFPNTAYSLFAVYSNTVAPAASQYMNVMYGSNGFPMLGTFDTGKYVTARSVVANTGAFNPTVPVGWAARIGSTSTDNGTAVAVDSSGNVFVGGYYQGTGATVYNQGPSGTALVTLPGTATVQGVVAKYSSTGAAVWAARIIPASSTVLVRAIAADSSGNVVVTGSHTAAVTFYNQGAAGTSNVTLPYIGGGDCFVTKYNSIGDVQWAARITGAGASSSDEALGIATDSSGNMVVTGSYGQGTGTAVTIYNQGALGTGAVRLPFVSGGEAFIAKYLSNGTVSWAARIAASGTFGEVGRAIATDSSGNVFVIGDYNGSVTIYNQGALGTGAITLPYIGGSDCFIAKYSSAGAVVWAARIGGTTTSTELGYGIATDSSGDVVVVGYYNATVTVYNATSVSAGSAFVTLPSIGSGDTFVAKYSSTGAVVWAARIGGSGADSGIGIATDSSGNVLVTGNYGAAVTFYNQGASGTGVVTLPYIGGGDCFIAKYLSDGTVSWAARIAGAGATTDGGRAIADDSSGNVFIVGEYTGTATFYNQGSSGEAGTTLSSIGGLDIFVAKYTPDGYIALPIPANSNVLVDATYLPSTMSPFVNGSATNTRAGTTLATTGLYLGGPSNYFNGTLSELIIYSATLSTSQRQKVEGYLLNKWRLASQMIATQPYLTRFPSSAVSFLPTSIAGCTLWLDAGDSNQFMFGSGSNISRWYDKSGQNNFMHIEGTPPTYSNGGVYMGGSGNMIRNTSGVVTNSNTLFCVFKQVSSGGPLYSTSSVASGQTGFFPNDNGSYYLTTGNASWATAASPLASNTIQMVATRYVNNVVGSNVSAFFNGSNSISTTQAATIAYVYFRLGNRFDGTVNTYFTGFFYEVIVYSNALTGAQRESVEGYLAKKWGITLPTTHSYYNISPAVD